jgi:hypothetical protein
LFELFSQGVNHYCKNPEIPNHLSSYLDQTVYKGSGKQQPFRFVLSGKAIKHRDAPPFTQEQLTFVSSNILYFVCTKSEIDTILITSQSPEYQNLKNYLSQFKFSKYAEIDKRRINKNDLYTEIDNELHEQQIQIKHAIHSANPHSIWWHDLVVKIKLYIRKHPKVENGELFEIFNQEEYDYFSNSRQCKISAPDQVHSAIRAARENPIITTNELIDKRNKTNEEYNNINNSIKYTIDEFKKIVSDYEGISAPELAKLIHYTFIFFTRSDSDKSSILSILYTENEGQIVIKTYEEFIKSLKSTPINIKLQRMIQHIDNRRKDKTPVLKQVWTIISLQTAFDYFDKYKQRYYDFRLCTKNEAKTKYFSLYSKATSAPETPLPEAIERIIGILSTELSEEPDEKFKVNEKKKEYILNWFAYMLQHPESRNAVCLQISTVQGVGKNLLSNAICNYMGSFFSEPSKDIENVCGTYNGGIDNKLFIVMNEVDKSKKNIDKLKAIITEDTIQINVKYGLQYTGLNCANYIIFSNHLDTNTISHGDRRFTFIKSYGLPESKDFYASICVPGKEGYLLPEIQEQFINHLLSRDLSDYKPNKAEEFDKHLIIEAKQDKRSSIHTFLLTLLKKGSHTIAFLFSVFRKRLAFAARLPRRIEFHLIWRLLLILLPLAIFLRLREATGFAFSERAVRFHLWTEPPFMTKIFTSL